MKRELKRLGIPYEGIGVLGFDISAYFPYSNQDALVLEASLSTEPQAQGSVLDIREMSIVNHRYTNKGYVCLSSRHGRKICRDGCFIYKSFDELNRYAYLNLGYGFESRGLARFSIPIQIRLSEELPCAGAEVRLMLKYPNEPDIIIIVHERADDNLSYWERKYAINVHENLGGHHRFTQLTAGNGFEAYETGWIVFEQSVDLIPNTPENTMI